MIEEPRREPTFHEFASEWLEGRRHELGERTVEDYTWALSIHLLPFFARHRLGAITIEDVDRYRSAKVQEGRLSARSSNKTISLDALIAGPKKAQTGTNPVSAEIGHQGEPEAEKPLSAQERELR